MSASEIVSAKIGNVLQPVKPYVNVVKFLCKGRHFKNKRNAINPLASN